MNEKIINYIICKKTDDNKYNMRSLTETVRERLQEGWQPYGSPFRGDDNYDAQAMVKNED